MHSYFSFTIKVIYVCYLRSFLNYASKEMCKIQALFIGILKSELLYLLDELESPVRSRGLTRDFLSNQKSLSLRFHVALEQEKRKFGMILN